MTTTRDVPSPKKNPRLKGKGERDGAASTRMNRSPLISSGEPDEISFLLGRGQKAPPFRPDAAWRFAPAQAASDRVASDSALNA